MNSEIKQISRTTPFPAQLFQRQLLTKEGSTKETYHITLDIAGSGLAFKVGDSLGVYGQNDPILVDRILEALGASGHESIVEPKSNAPLTLKTFLLEKANIGRTNKSLLQLLSFSEPVPDGFDLLDLLLLRKPTQVPLQEFCNQFSPLLPRFYSIASSQMQDPHTVDLTVSLSSYEHKGEKRYGVASNFLCRLAEMEKTPIPIYLQPTPHFTLPKEPETHIIMIGPGTGVAPFRGFMQERTLSRCSGKNWLFFGERNRATDFFYEEFWLDLHKQGHLHLDLAFSRDQEEKCYVQHLLLSRQADLWNWLESGAVIYVCGEAEKMARSIEDAWLQIFEAQGGMSSENAKLHLRTLKKEKRYLTDVY